MSENIEELKNKIEELRDEIYEYEDRCYKLENEICDLNFKYSELAEMTDIRQLLNYDIRDLLEDLSNLDIPQQTKNILNNFFWKTISEKLK